MTDKVTTANREIGNYVSVPESLLDKIDNISIDSDRKSDLHIKDDNSSSRSSTLRGQAHNKNQPKVRNPEIDTLKGIFPELSPNPRNLESKHSGKRSSVPRSRSSLSVGSENENEHWDPLSMNPEYNIDANASEDEKDTTAKSQGSDGSESENSEAWSTRETLLLVTWLGRTCYMLTAHYKGLRTARFWYQTLTILHVLLAAAVSLGTGNLSVVIDSNMNWFSRETFIFTLALMAMMNSALAGILAFKDYGNRIVNEQKAITKFSQLFREIELCLYSNNRPKAGDWLASFSKQYYVVHSATDVIEESIPNWNQRVSEINDIISAIAPGVRAVENGKIIDASEHINNQIKIENDQISASWKEHKVKKRPSVKVAGVQGTNLEIKVDPSSPKSTNENGSLRLRKNGI